VSIAETGKKGLDIASSDEFSVVVTDVRLPDVNGIELISRLKKINPFCEVIVLTAYGTIPDGVKAIKEGAFDYLTKGDEDNKIVPLIDRAVEKVNMSIKINRLEKSISEKYSFENIIGVSAKIAEAVKVAKRVSETDTTVLLTGQTGTGKEIFAQSIHYAGKRKNNSFVAVNCSSFTKELLESELFGYLAGAFTGASRNKRGLFEEANNGTLFLDEIGELDLSLQSKLLRVLETNSFIKTGDTRPTKVDVRIITATNRDLEDETKKGNFRSDLYYRIGVMRINIPPLHERKEDIKLFADYFIKFYSTKMNRNIKNVHPEFYKKLLDYSYPGNIRELRNIIERAVILSENEITSDNLPKDLHYSGKYGEESDKLEEVEKLHILSVLDKVGGNKTKAAELLGIGLTTLYRKPESFNLV
ncbi:MAG: sigma-54 dependent transcriptional regulator, partial [Ignavibacteriaceae bacterium]